MYATEAQNPHEKIVACLVIFMLTVALGAPKACISGRKSKIELFLFIKINRCFDVRKKIITFSTQKCIYVIKSVFI